nr:hypothetical protein CFP56_55121 [Quercus suber]
MEISSSPPKSSGDLENSIKIRWKSRDLCLDLVEVDSFTDVLTVLSETESTRGKSDSIRPIGSIGRQQVHQSATR